ncbi:MAG: hypothetical protein R3E65_09130 [Steroidobacteraceae bacterium]
MALALPLLSLIVSGAVLLFRDQLFVAAAARDGDAFIMVGRRHRA